jgi:hypothetical protein
MTTRPRFRLAALLLAASLPACTDAGSRGDAGAPSAGAALTFDRLRCASRTGRRTCDLYHASVAELIANPREFHGKPVRVVGFMHIEPEASGLYLGEADFRHAIHRNGIWLNSPPGADTLSDSYVRVEATFDASSQGNFGKWSGTLKDVTHLSRWTETNGPGDAPGPTGSEPSDPTAVRRRE